MHTTSVFAAFRGHLHPRHFSIVFDILQLTNWIANVNFIHHREDGVVLGGSDLGRDLNGTDGLQRGSRLSDTFSRVTPAFANAKAAPLGQIESPSIVVQEVIDDDNQHALRAEPFGVGARAIKRRKISQVKPR